VVTEDYRVPVAETDRIRAALAVQLIAAATGVSAERMCARRHRGSRACRARWLALYLAHIAFGWPLERVGHAFGLNRATVSAACRWAEDERDRPALDVWLDRLEACARDICDAPACDLPT
jgi:chromosomal replication initiation ATPase DnaA